MFSGVSTICFAAGYAVALALEASRLALGGGARRAAALGVAGAGLLAHAVFLYSRVTDALGRSVSPLSSEADWYFAAAWAVVAVYLYFALEHPKAPFGLFLLPLALAMIAAGMFWANPTPLAHEPAMHVWGAIHGTAIALAAVAVLLGFAAGLMYLGQVRHLKHKILSTRDLRLPSLEWLERLGRAAIVTAAAMAGAGVLAGMILNLIHIHAGYGVQLVWHDPVVVSTWVMFCWFAAVAVAVTFYRPARKGRAIAWLAVLSFAFLAIVLAAGLTMGSRHWERGGAGRGAGGEGGLVHFSASRRILRTNGWPKTWTCPLSGGWRVESGGRPC